MEWLNDDELPVFRAFNRAHRALVAVLDDELQTQTGLSRANFDLLWLLRRSPGRAMRMSEMATATDSKASRITHAVTRLEEGGLVLRRPVPGDRRGYEAVLTDDGLQAVEAAAPVLAASIRRHFLGLLTPQMAEQVVLIGNTILQAGLAPVDNADSRER